MSSVHTEQESEHQICLTKGTVDGIIMVMFSHTLYTRAQLSYTIEKWIYLKKSKTVTSNGNRLINCPKQKEKKSQKEANAIRLDQFKNHCLKNIGQKIH